MTTNYGMLESCQLKRVIAQLFLSYECQGETTPTLKVSKTVPMLHMLLCYVNELSTKADFSSPCKRIYHHHMIYGNVKLAAFSVFEPIEHFREIA